tara:strand:+ start:201 stop:347 length:147 start_codon:yes stop_codon:yes gene_type:complete
LQKKNSKNLALALKQNLMRRKSQVKKRKMAQENLAKKNQKSSIKDKVN